MFNTRNPQNSMDKSQLFMVWTCGPSTENDFTRIITLVAIDVAASNSTRMRRPQDDADDIIIPKRPKARDVRHNPFSQFVHKELH